MEGSGLTMSIPLCNPSRVPQHNLGIVQGQDGDGILVPVVDVANTPVDMTGWTGRAQVRETYEAELVDELTVTCNSTGVLVTWTGIQTSLWPQFTWGVWDLEVTSPSGNTTRLIEGKVYLSPEVTR